MQEAYQPPSGDLLARIEASAITLAAEAGELLAGYFGKPMEVEYKDKHRGDPVTVADKESQDLLKKAIAAEYPDHSILGEEDEEEDTLAQDFVWVLDPLDGTKNFLSGLPMYACSVGVLHRGVPVAGALYLPWPGDAGAVLHARAGGGAFMGREPISVFEADEPEGNRLTALPGSFGAGYRFRKPMRGKAGEVRVTGSIAYELALTAKGSFQYSVIGRPRLWDVAAGAVLVAEAGGLVMRGIRPSGVRSLFASTRWEPAASLVPSWRSGVTTLKKLRRRSATLVLGGPAVVRYVTSNMRRRPLLRYRLRRLSRRLTRRGDR